jgi:hypothetical protein
MATVKQILAMSDDERTALNDAALSLLTNVSVPIAAFHEYALKHWQVKFSGPKPTVEMTKMNGAIDGGRRSGYEPMWLAQTLRPEGASVGEYMRHQYGPNSDDTPKGAAHNNACKYNNERGGPAWFVRVPVANAGRAGRWRHVITDKGMAQLAKRVAALTGAAAVDTAAKNKAISKLVKVARKRNATPVAEVPVEQPVNEAPAADVPQAVTPEQFQALAAQFNS